MIMDNQVNNTHTFINNNNFNNANSLTHLLDTDEPEVEVSNIKLSEYCDIKTLSKSLQHAKGGLSILSLNSQSLTLSDPGYFRQLTIRGGGFKSPPLRSRKLLCQSSPYHTCDFYQMFLA